MNNEQDMVTNIHDNRIESPYFAMDNSPFNPTDVLTTIDNPYNPKEEFTKWYAWDTQNGYNTSEYIGRLADYEVDDDATTTRYKYELAMMFILIHNEDMYKIV